MAKKVAIPWELKADFRLRTYSSLFKAYLYEIREQYGAVTALKLYETTREIS